MLTEMKVKSDGLVGVSYSEWAGNTGMTEDYCPYGRHAGHYGNFLSLDGRVVAYKTMTWPVQPGVARFDYNTYVYKYTK
jgi:hypothetical protein